ncbi:endolytic transglycosylase MltG [Corallococcus sp. H22C18031201]|uniref:endolytic transglycosylase MltG n=1 Tax=Citreicoccus inhibens TaxID=2849499 RepID=UPI000E72FC22|nr:endolytic transglycosylase MltG [Citreicoccus inhibens]MBU8896029.1 endolytic transglycosylase MltG [Citreicoccus inhibens]RJS25903.1 endolytic transglycosylase MltG [Corallococcus sp. H22C18031201]
MKKVLLALLVLALLAGAAAGGWYQLREQRITEFAATAVTLATPVTVEIPSGTGPRALARLLTEQHVTTDAELLYLYIRRENLGPKLKAGEYEFSGDLTPTQALEKILSGQVKVYRFTVPEGLRAEEILPIVADSELKLDLKKLEALAASPAFLRKAGVPAQTIEGFLFPDTYTFTRNATEESVLTKMVARALEEYKHADADRKNGVKLDLLQTFTLASIVEKETGAPQERPRISCVFHNRLKKGMRLETDPTVIYAMRLLRGVYNKNITRKDLETLHPYNTYKVAGLPPGPIASPGTAALQAALHPIECEDLFFVSRNDGTHLFCPTYECHEANVRKWQVEFFRKPQKQGANSAHP